MDKQEFLKLIEGMENIERIEKFKVYFELNDGIEIEIKWEE